MQMPHKYMGMGQGYVIPPHAQTLIDASLRPDRETLIVRTTSTPMQYVWTTWRHIYECRADRMQMVMNNYFLFIDVRLHWITTPTLLQLCYVSGGMISYLQGFWVTRQMYLAHSLTYIQDGRTITNTKRNLLVDIIRTVRPLGVFTRLTLEFESYSNKLHLGTNSILQQIKYHQSTQFNNK